MALARWQATITDTAGNVQSAASIEVRREVAGAPLVSLFSDRDGVTPIGNPFAADSNGFAACHMAGGSYRITATKGSYSQTWRYVAVGTSAEYDAGSAVLMQAIDAGYGLVFEEETTGTPSAGAIRFDNVDLSAATEAYVSVVNAAGSGIDDRLLELYSAVRGVKDGIIIAHNESGAQASFSVDGAVAVGSPATHVTLTLSGHNGATSFAAADGVHLQRERAGANGGMDGASAYMQTVLDAEDADEAHVALDSAARFSEHLGWKVTGLTADNKTGALATTMTLSADFIVLYNPSDDTTKRVFAPSPVDCSIATSGAGGRDQVAAFVTGDDSIWFYFIWGAVHGLSTICSKTAPGAGGPTLPATYTHFCPAFPVKVFIGITLQPALPLGGATTLAVRGNRLFYNNTPFWDHGTTGYPTGLADFTGWVPSFATMFDVYIDLEAQFDTPGIGGAYFGAGGQNFFNASLYAYTAHEWSICNATLCNIIVPGRQFSFTMDTSSGHVENFVAYLGPIGYSF